MSPETCLLAALVVVTVLQWLSQRRLDKRFLMSHNSLLIQAKAINREAERTRRDAVKSLDSAQKMRDEAQELYSRVDRTLADPGLRSVLAAKE